MGLDCHVGSDIKYIDYSWALIVMLPLSLPRFDDLRDGHIKSPCSAFFYQQMYLIMVAIKNLGVKMFLIEVSKEAPTYFL